MIEIEPEDVEAWVVTPILLQMIGGGMIIGISSSISAALLSLDSPINTTADQATSISSIIGTACFVSYCLFLYIVSICGRRASVLIGLAPGILGPFICYFSTDINVFILGRFITGITYGTSNLLAVIIGEYVSPEYRGVFLNMKAGAYYFGCMIAHFMNQFINWKTNILIATIPFIAQFAMTCTWPESPAWLASKQRFDECMESFYWLRGRSENSAKELADIIRAQKEQVHHRRTKLDDFKIVMLRFKMKNFLKPMGVHLLATILMEFSGRHIFAAYAIEIINKVNSDNAYNFYYILGLYVLIIFSGLLSLVLGKSIKRRTLLLTSGGLSVIVLLVVCVFDYLLSISLVSNAYKAVTIIILGIYLVTVNAGSTPICMTLVGEIFPIEHRPAAVAISGLLVSIFMMITLKITPAMIAVINFYGTFSIFALIMTICLVILYYTMPETKDKTLQEVEDFFNNYSIRKHFNTSNDLEAEQKLCIKSESPD